MKSILYCTFMAMSVGLIIASYSFAEAGVFNKKKNKSALDSVTISEAPASASVLKSFVSKVSADFDQLNVLMSQRKYEAAMTLAKQSLDEARMKIGFDPKSNRKEIIEVPKNTYTQGYDYLGKSLASFPVAVQNNVMKSIERHRSGYFLDLLNLLKRTNLIYIQAFHQVLKNSSSGILKEDIQKIRNDINAVRAIPLYLQDPASASLLLIFDYEVANSDQNYLFNRELKTYLLTQGQDLGYKPESLEQTIDAELEERVRIFIAKFVATERETASQKTSSNPFEDPNYLKCMQTIVSRYDTKKHYADICIENYQKYNYTNPSFVSCFNQMSDRYNTNEYYANQCLRYAKF